MSPTALAAEGVFLYHAVVPPPDLICPAPHLILASRSPRRAQLLQEAGYTFTQMDPPFADPAQPALERGAEDPKALAVELAEAKACSAAAQPSIQQEDATLILGADTIVVAPDGSLLGQPLDRANARQMLNVLQNHVHQVVTGVCLLAPGTGARVCFADAASVKLSDPGLAELEHYLAGDDWRGKAGAYNLSELGFLWKANVVGDPSTVVGLPMRMLTQVLLRWGVKPIRR